MHAWTVVANGEPLREVELPIPETRGSEVLLEVMFCGVCHSDVHLWEGHYGIGGDKKLLLKDRGVRLPLVMGHEIVGRVTALGPDAAGVAVGDVRIVYPWLGCGKCTLCRSEQDNMCATPRSIGVFQNGGYASHVAVPHARYLIEPGALTPSLAATFACSGLTAYSAVKKALPLPSDDAIVVIGAGGLGLSAIGILRALGHERILAVDVNEANREAALHAGASDAIDGGRANMTQAVVDACQGSVAAAIDFVNSSQTASMAFDALRRGGKLIQVGFFGGELKLPLPLMPLRALTVQGSYVGSPRDLQDLVNLSQDGKMPHIPVATVPRSSVNEVLSSLRAGKVTGRVVLNAAAR